MSQTLCFNDVQFDVIPQNSQPWIRSPQIAEALGYGQANRINDLYSRHADEFTDAMTAVVTLPTEGGPQETRIFSLRGCHLLAMFARTPVAKAFRRWVLDVLDRLNAEQVNPEPPRRGRPRKALPISSPALTPSPTAFQCARITPEAYRLITEAEQEIRELHSMYHDQWGRISEKLQKAVWSCIPYNQASLAIYDAMFEITRKAVTYPDPEHIPNYVMPYHWLEQIIPAMLGRRA